MNIGEIYKRKGEIRADAQYSILIPSWNNLPYLKICLESIAKNSSLPHQVIVHVNEGNDETIDWLISKKDVSYTHSRENIGVCYALNIARSLMTTNYLVYVNDDMYVCPDWDKFLFEEIAQIGHKKFFLSSTAIEPVPQSTCSIKGNFGLNAEEFDEKNLLNSYIQMPFEDWSGATWPPNIVHVDYWDLVGGYSTEFSPGMYSDPDFSMKLWNAGIRVFKGVSKSRVYHFGSISTRKVLKNRGYYQFIAKWGMASSTLTKYFLRRGEKYTGTLAEPIVPGKVKLKNWWKRIAVGDKAEI